MILYCVVVSSVVGVEALSGVTEVLLLSSGDEYSLSSSCLPIFHEADRHRIGGSLAVLQHSLWACIELSRSSRKVSRPSPIVIGLSQVANNKQSTYYETHSVSSITGIANEGRYLSGPVNPRSSETVTSLGLGHTMSKARHKVCQYRQLHTS